MFTERKEVSDYYPLKEKFLNELSKGIQIDSYKRNEQMLRKSLSKQIKNGDLF